LRLLHDKAAFADLAAELGYGADENRVLTSLEAIKAIENPEAWVFKPVFSRFATQTLIGPSKRDLRSVAPSSVQPWLAQTRIRGDEFCVYNVADHGRLLLHVAYAPTVRFGKGASIYFAEIRDERLRRLSETFVARTQFTGQIGFDVMAHEQRLVAIECNPRGTSGVHLVAQSPNVLAAALLGQESKKQAGEPEPRMLLGPWFLQSPGTIFRARDRALRARARDALTSAEIAWPLQACALAEMTWLALRARTNVAAASTADIEWNGEAVHG